MELKRRAIFRIALHSLNLVRSGVAGPDRFRIDRIDGGAGRHEQDVAFAATEGHV